MVLLPGSPYQNLTSAKVSLLILFLAGKTITLLRATQGADNDTFEPVFTPKKQILSKKWIFITVNFSVLVKEVSKTTWSYCPDFLKNWVDNIGREPCFCIKENNVTKPVNLRILDSSEEALQRDVEHSFLVCDFYLKNFPHGVQFLKGKKVLEIGPGINFGPILILACHGAEVLVADRFLTPWDSDYHPKFYALLRDSLIKRWPSINPTPLDMVLSQGGYPTESIFLHSCSLEELSGVPDQSIDIVFSNAVLEHLYDLKSAFFHLARITKPGGIGFHNVDFRDHRDFSRPLEYLLLSNKEFSREFKERHGECGNRYRPEEMRHLFELVGFEVKDLHPIFYIDEDYLAEFLGRLRQGRKSRYRDYPVEDLRLIVGSFIVIKKHANILADIAGEMSFLSRVAGCLGWR